MLLEHEQTIDRVSFDIEQVFNWFWHPGLQWKMKNILLNLCYQII